MRWFFPRCVSLWTLRSLLALFFSWLRYHLPSSSLSWMDEAFLNLVVFWSWLAGFLPEGKLKSFWLLLLFLNHGANTLQHPQAGQVEDLGDLCPVVCIALRCVCFAWKPEHNGGGVRGVGEHFVLGQLRAWRTGEVFPLVSQFDLIFFLREGSLTVSWKCCESRLCVLSVLKMEKLCNLYCLFCVSFK